MKFLFLASLFFLIACSKNEQSYFPFEQIRSWSYSIKIKKIPELENSVTYKKTTISLGRKKIKINNKSISSYPFLRENGTTFYYQTSDEGIFRKGIKFLESPNILLEKKKRTVLMYPLEVGKKWTVESKTFLILKRYPYYDYRATTNFQLKYKVISTNEIVQTPMGKFKNCLKILGTGKTSFIGNSEIGTIDIEVSSEEWYAKNVGLLKTVRTEKTNSVLFGHTKMVQFLENYQKN